MILFFLCIFLSIAVLHGKNMLDAVQEIHKTVGSSLLSVRKNYPESQVQVYTTIDQVSKLCDLAKRQHSKRKLLKADLATEKSKLLEMKNKMELVAQKMTDAQKKINEQAEKILVLTQQKEEAIASLQKSITPPAPQHSFRTTQARSIESNNIEQQLENQDESLDQKA